MTRKTVLLSLVWFAVVLVGAVGFARADSSELAAITAALHEQGRMWVAGETAISKLPIHERALRARLIKPQATGREQVIGQGALQASAPGSLDWRNNGVVTSVKDQGSCGSCWDFATTAALESFLLISQPTIFNNPATLDLSEQVLLTCGGAGNCNGGYIDKASNYVHDTGLPPEYLNSNYTYQPSNTKCPSGWPVAGQADKSQGWGWVTTTSVSVGALKNALATYGPLITTMEVYNDFFSYVSGVYQHTSGSLAGGHAVLIVGYADDTTTPAWGGGYFIVKNSWNTNWGEGGYFRIAYSETSSKVLFGEWTIADIVCTYSITPTSASPSAAGGTGSVTVTASASTCSWTASSNNSSWLSVSPTSGTGSGKISYTVQQNTGSARTGTATIAGNTFTVNQAAASAGAPVISVSPTSINFGSVRVGRTSTGSVTISNKGTANLSITALGITGTSATDFTQTNTCVGSPIAPNKSCTVQVTFKPSSRTSESASLSITSNDSAHSPVNVPLSGSGL